MKVLLIDPKGFSKGLNPGLGYLAAILKKNSHGVKVLDFQNKEGDEEARLQKAFEWAPDIIGISIFHMTLPESKRVIRYCRENYPDALYIAGGPAVTLKKEKFFEDPDNMRLFHAIVVGEGEQTLVELASGKKIVEIDGMIFHKDGKIISNKPRQMNMKLDEYPFPDYTDFDSFTGKLDKYALITSRGCPQACAFCANKELNNRVWRGHSPEYVVNEIKHVMKTYGTNDFAIWDSNFSLDMDRSKKICDMIFDQKLGIKFSTPDGLRADCVDRELLEKLKRAGCHSTSIGIEDGCPETFPYINKGETLQQIEDAVKMMKDVGINVRASMIIGAINATFMSTMESIKFVKKLGIEAHWYLAIPFEGTALYDWVKQNGTALTDFENFTDVDKIRKNFEPLVAFETEEFTKENRLRAFYIANAETGNFYALALDGMLSQIVENDKPMSRAKRILKRTWKHNKKRTPRAFAYLVKEMFKKV